MIGRVKQWFVHTSLAKVIIKDFQSLLKMKETRPAMSFNVEYISMLKNII